MKYLDLFSGIGGFALGIQQAYESNNEYAPLSEESEPQERQEGRVRTINLNETQLHNRNRTAPLCVGYSEIDKYAIQVYEKHFPNHKNFGDITKINAKELPDFDLLVGGFPCQAFSIAGKRRGFEDTRGTLFFEIARILRDKRPRYFLLENVKGLLSHDSGKTFQTILGVLTDIGYEYQWQVLNSKNFGVPQNRERVFIIGNLRGEPSPKVFPIGKANENNTQSPQELREQNSNTLRTNYGGATSNETYIAEIRQMNNPIHSNDRIYSPEGISPTLNTAQGGNRQPKVMATYRHPFEGFNGYEDMSPSIKSTEGSGNQILINKIRRLTPVECERLQGFPDNWTDILSDTQRYKTLGNAVTTNVITEIIKRLYANTHT